MGKLNHKNHYRGRLLITRRFRKVATVSFLGIVFAFGSIITNQYLNTQSAQAVTPPDSCFAFNSSTGTITDYYDNEGNNSANPACPRAVDIPSTIGGVAVTGIGASAFYNNQLTALTIPDSVTNVGHSAFRANQLTTLPSYFSNPDITTIPQDIFSENKFTNLTIPSNITRIGNSAFSHNQLTTLTIPNSVTSIGIYAFYNNHLTSLQIDSPSTIASIGVSAFIQETTSITTDQIVYS